MKSSQHKISVCYEMLHSTSADFWEKSSEYSDPQKGGGGVVNGVIISFSRKTQLLGTLALVKRKGKAIPVTGREGP
jgi:hypothetical protein